MEIVRIPTVSRSGEALFNNSRREGTIPRDRPTHQVANIWWLADHVHASTNQSHYTIEYHPACQMWSVGFDDRRVATMFKLIWGGL